MKVYNTYGAFSHVATMLMDYYANDPRYANTTVLFGYNMVDKYHDIPFEEIVANEKAAGNRVINYQLEQLYDGSMWANEPNLRKLRLADEIWDYDVLNIEYLEKRGIKAKFRPMMYSKSLDTIKPNKKDIDVLFYGSINDYRSKALTYIQKNISGKIQTFTNVWGSELERVISRSKIVLNVHYFPEVRQEQVRLFYLVGNGACVVSEESRYNYFGNSILSGSIDDLPGIINELLFTGSWSRVGLMCREQYKNQSRNVFNKIIH